MKRAMATTRGSPGMEESQGKGPNDEGSRKKTGADKSDKTVKDERAQDKFATHPTDPHIDGTQEYDRCCECGAWTLPSRYYCQICGEGGDKAAAAKVSR